MPRKRVFFLTDAALVVYQQKARDLVRSQVFENNQGGLREFVNYLEKDPWTPICFLLDLVDEEFRLENVPHVFGSDRRALVMNRQRRLFRNTPYRHTVFQDRVAGGRRDDNVLFAAITRPEKLQCWLGPIARRGIPLAGVYSLPILSKELLPYIESTLAWNLPDYMLLAHWDSAGLRQSFFYRRHLKVSRVARLEKSGDMVFEHISEEMDNIRRYLAGLRLLPEDRPLEAYFLGNTETWRHQGRHITETGNVRYHFVDMAKTGAKIGMREDVQVLTADPLFAGILIRATPANHYATPNDLRYFRSARMRGTTYAIGLIVLAMGIALGIFRLADILIIGRETALLARQAEVYEAHYARSRTNSSEIPADGRTLKAVVETAIGLRESKTTPYGMLSALSKVLNGREELEIEEIEWWAGNAADSPVDTHAVSGRSGTRAQSPTSPGSVPNRTANEYQIAVIKGRIAAFSGNYREAMMAVEEFAKALSGIEEMEEVRIIRQPLDLGPEKTLEGKAGAAPGNANFALRMIFRNNGEGSGFSPCR